MEGGGEAGTGGVYNRAAGTEHGVSHPKPMHPWSARQRPHVPYDQRNPETEAARREERTGKGGARGGRTCRGSAAGIAVRALRPPPGRIDMLLVALLARVRIVRGRCGVRSVVCIIVRSMPTACIPPALAAYLAKGAPEGGLRAGASARGSRGTGAAAATNAQFANPPVRGTRPASQQK